MTNYISSLINDMRKQIKICVRKNGKKHITTVKGYICEEPKQTLKKWKKKFSCNGFLNEYINLQGDQSENV